MIWFKLYSMILVAIIMIIAMYNSLKAKDDEMFWGLIIITFLIMPLWYYIWFSRF